MSNWFRIVDVPDYYDRDPENLMIHKVDANDLKLYWDGKRSDVTAVCTKTWAPTMSGLVEGRPFCPYCFPKRSNLTIAI